MSEFNLSEKMIDEEGISMLGFHSAKDFYSEKDVKEFIRLLRARYNVLALHLLHSECEICQEKIQKFREEIDKLAGEKLTEKK